MKLMTMLLIGGLLAGCAGVQPQAGAPAVDEQAFYAYMHKHVTAMWFRPEGFGLAGKRAEVEVELDAGGRVEASRITKSSGNAAFDASLLQAVKRAGPFPLPTENPEKFRKIRLYFKG